MNQDYDSKDEKTRQTGRGRQRTERVGPQQWAKTVAGADQEIFGIFLDQPEAFGEFY